MEALKKKYGFGVELTKEQATEACAKWLVSHRYSCTRDAAEQAILAIINASRVNGDLPTMPELPKALGLEEFFAKIAGVAYGKNTVPKSRIEKWMEKISQSMLPAATAADVGKAVVVDENGGYALGEKKTYTATGEMTSAAEGTWTSDYDSSELQAAFLAGNNVVFNIINMGSVAVQWINAVGSLCAYTYISGTGTVRCEVKEDGTIQVYRND